MNGSDLKSGLNKEYERTRSFIAFEVRESGIFNVHPCVVGGLPSLGVAFLFDIRQFLCNAAGDLLFVSLRWDANAVFGLSEHSDEMQKVLLVRPVRSREDQGDDLQASIGYQKQVRTIIYSHCAKNSQRWP